MKNTSIVLFLVFILFLGKSFSQAEIELPSKQKKFVDLVVPYISKYNDAANDLKKSSLRKDRRNNLANMFPSLKISNWIGVIESMGTNSDGDAYIEISIPNTEIQIQTWNNSFSDMDDNTLIKNGSKLYNQIADLNESDVIIFSGTFISDKNGLYRDYFKEGSLTEWGSMTAPEFIFRFSSVKKQ